MHVRDVSRRRRPLYARIRGARIDDDLVNLPVLAEVLVLLEDLCVGKPRRQSNDKDEVLLHNANVR